MPPHHRVRTIPEVRGERCSRADSVGNLLRRRAGVADTRDHSVGCDLFDVARRLRPLWRQSYDPDLVAGRFLPSLVFIDIRRPDPAPRMRAARPILRRDVRTFDMKAIDGGALPQMFLRAPQVA